MSKVRQIWQISFVLVKSVWKFVAVGVTHFCKRTQEGQFALDYTACAAKYVVYQAKPITRTNSALKGTHPLLDEEKQSKFCIFLKDMSVVNPHSDGSVNWLLSPVH